ncbi:MAG: hypothetical protein J5806_08135 [Lentisphaeria bacterium]|nr:hypothetical protein [Lentisphaeria bacterium]
MKKKTGLLLLLIVPVFLLYFLSESFLRAAAVANINPAQVKLDNILNELPESIRDVVTYRIMHTDLTNALAKASDEKEKLALMAQLGDYTRDLEEKEKIFRFLRQKYPNRAETAPAYVYYLLREDSPDRVTMADFHRYLQKLPQLERFNIWAMALNRLTQLKVSGTVRMEFLLPLLEMKPEYRDYSIFYTELVELAMRYQKPAVANRADALIDECRLQPSLAEVELEEMEKENQRREEAAKKRKGERK